MEFASQALSFTINAEQSAANNAWLHGEEGVQIVAVSAAPCGNCRQFLKELTTADRSLRLIYKKSADPSDNSYETMPCPPYCPKRSARPIWVYKGA